MKAITVRHPWCWAIAVGVKDVENRQAGFPRHHRGPTLIHAAKGWSTRGLTDPRILAAARRLGASLDDLPRGVVVAVAHLTDVHRSEPGCCDSEWAEERYTINGGKVIEPVAHLVLERVEPIADPIPCRGALGLWTPPPHVAALAAA